VLIYCTNVISRQLWDLLRKKIANAWKSVFIIITGSLMMVLYDLFLEPAAMRLDMWSWEGGRIPFSNYAAWFLLSVLFHTLVRITGEEKINSRAMPLFAVQIGFFAVIDIFYLL
jgi:putative membrane protein